MTKILLVDDDESFRPMLYERLQRLGYQVTAARNGHEALACYRADPADLVLTDLVMPEKEGIETIRDLLCEAPDVRIVAMSGGSRGNAPGYLRIALSLGAAAVLSKPFSTQELLDAIAVALGPAADAAPVSAAATDS